ncbi:hypothetical protein [Streptomyces gelaticus]|uniref:hypothetical protein n=1 Tax=Streptomyces gelaticus TaxID=285446 RepID=UPI0016728767|nr:hypothetical protein [Streptomyces gelaticus]
MGGGTLYFLLDKEKGEQTHAGNSSQGGRTSDATKDGKKETDSKPSNEPDPKPAEYKGINLTAGYHLTLGDDNVRPQQGEDGGYELS